MTWATSVQFPSAVGQTWPAPMRRTGQPECDSSPLLRLATISFGRWPDVPNPNAGGCHETPERRSVNLLRRRHDDRDLEDVSHHDLGAVTRPAHTAEEPGRRHASAAAFFDGQRKEPSRAWGRALRGSTLTSVHHGRRISSPATVPSHRQRQLGRVSVVPGPFHSAFDGRWRARLKANPYALDHSLGGSIEALKTHVFVSAGYPSTGSRRLFVSDQFLVGEMRDV